MSIIASTWSPERPGSTWTVALGMRDAVYSACWRSTPASASPTISPVGAWTLGRMSRTSVCQEIRMIASATSGSQCSE